MKHNRLKQFFQDFYLALILLFLYIPIVTMIVLSFNNTKSRTVWGGFTTRWYTQMFQDSAIMNALNNTLLIAFASALIATVIGTIAAIGINSMKRIPRTIVMGINNIPMLNSDIVTEYNEGINDLYGFRIWKALWDQQTDHRIQRRAVVSSRAFKLAKGSEIVRKNGKDQLSADPHQPV